MLELIISFFFLSWFLVSVTYVFDKQKLGKFSKILHRYGWLNEWTMYKNYAAPKGKLIIYFRNLEKIDGKEEWEELKLNSNSPIKFLLNVNGRLRSFYDKCCLKSNREIKTADTDEFIPPVFSYLCAVVNQIPSSSNSNFRQVKIEEITSEGLVKEVIRSKITQLK